MLKNQYGQYLLQVVDKVELTEDNHRQFFILPGFCARLCSIELDSGVPYKCDNFYYPEADGGISILDASLGIDWRIPIGKAILSEKDTKHPLLKEFETPFEYGAY